MADKVLQTKVEKKNLTERKVFDLILPCTGCTCYGLFSTTLTIPRQVSRLLGRRDALIADILWLNAHFGLGLYLYRQRFMKASGLSWRITYTAFSTVMFNFGSALIWGTTRSLLPTQPWRLQLLFGLSSGLAFLYTGWNFVQYLNSLVPEDKN